MIPGRHPISGSTHKEPGSHHFALTTSKKAEQTEKSTTLLRSIREGKTQGKPLPPTLERQENTGSHNLPEQRFGSRNCHGNPCQGRKT